MHYHKRVDELIELAFVDNSDGCEIDKFGIYLDEEDGRFCFISARGCSCWEGDYYEEKFDSLEDLEKALEDDDKRPYNPSIRGVSTLVDTAKKSMGMTTSEFSNFND